MFKKNCRFNENFVEKDRRTEKRERKDSFYRINLYNKLYNKWKKKAELQYIFHNSVKLLFFPKVH